MKPILYVTILLTLWLSSGFSAYGQSDNSLLENLNEQINQLKKDKESLIKANTSLVRDTADLGGKVRDLEIEKLHLEVKSVKLDSVQKALNTLEKKYDKLNKELVDEVNETVLLEVNKRVKSYKEKIKYLDSLNLSLENIQEDQERHINLLKKDSTQNQERGNIIDNKNVEINQLDSTKNELAKKNMNLTSQLNNSKKEYKRIQGEWDSGKTIIKESFSLSVEYFTLSSAFDSGSTLEKMIKDNADIIETSEGMLDDINSHKNLGTVISQVNEALMHKGTTNTYISLRNDLNSFLKNKSLSSYQKNMLTEAKLVLEGWCDAQTQVRSILNRSANNRIEKVKKKILVEGQNEISPRYKYLKDILIEVSSEKNYKNAGGYLPKVGNVCN